MLLQRNFAEINLRILKWKIISVDPVGRLNIISRSPVKEKQRDKSKLLNRSQKQNSAKFYSKGMEARVWSDVGKETHSPRVSRGK